MAQTRDLQETIFMCTEIYVCMCVAMKADYYMNVCKRMRVMARVELGQTAGLSHVSQKRSEGDKLAPSPVLEKRRRSR